MKFQTHNEREVDISGTSLVAQIEATYAELVDLFGQPLPSDEDKVDAEWHLQFEDGTIAAIYNYKNGRTYCGPDAPAVEDIRRWHIGGQDERRKNSEALVREVLAEKRAQNDENNP